MMERVRTWWFLCDQCSRSRETDVTHTRCAKRGTLRKYGTCGALDPNDICEDFDWRDE